MTSIFKRDGRPGFTLAWVEDGRKRQRQFKTKRAAEDHRDHLRARMRAQAGLGQDLLLSTYAEVWLERVRVGARPATHEQYAWAMEHHILPALGALSLRQLTRAHVKDFLTGKLEERLAPGAPRYQAPEPGAEPPRRLARTTVGHLRTTLHACLEEAVDDQLLASNPAALRRRSRTLRLAPTRAERRAKVKAFTTEQLAAFLAAAKTAAGPKALLFRVLAATGLRPGEGLGLKWQDLDLVGRSVRVCRTWSGGREGATKSGFEREVDLSKRLVDELRSHDAATKKAALASGEERPAWVFPNQAGKPMDDRHVVRVFKRVLKAAGLPGHYSPHSLRHTFASRLLQRGESVVYTQRQLGHATITLTADLYGAWLPAGNHASVDAADEALFSVTPGGRKPSEGEKVTFQSPPLGKSVR